MPTLEESREALLLTEQDSKCPLSDLRIRRVDIHRTYPNCFLAIFSPGTFGFVGTSSLARTPRPFTKPPATGINASEKSMRSSTHSGKWSDIWKVRHCLKNACLLLV